MPHLRLTAAPYLVFFCLYFAVALVFATDEQHMPASLATAAHPAAASVGCLSCHQAIQHDEHHFFACTRCHGGNGAEQKNQELAHQGLISQPAHPDHMQAACASCHEKQVAAASLSRHFSLDNKINTIRAHFGAKQKLTHPADIPTADSATAINTALALSDDMLRRLCLRCHVYSKGDEYSAVRRGSGCAACHLSFAHGKMVAHTFRLPVDQQCLSCHYGNYVGSDYYGRYEHDLPFEYRTPYTAETETGLPARPYGVEYHDLVADVHQERGLVCRDCHQGFVHGQAKSIGCKSCHNWLPTKPAPALANVDIHDKQLVLTGVHSGKKHLVPLMRDPAHQQYGQRVDCQVCHAQWSYNDTTTHVLLSYNPDYDPWLWLTVQGSFEVEKRLEDGLFSYAAEEEPAMRDGLTGISKPGMWYKGHTERRWERMLIGQDARGILRVLRPVLDLHLSMVDDQGEPLFDNLRGAGDGLKPYTPHTTGPAGLFYRDRLQGLSAP
ncbi:MAG: hypothetical protein HQQ73_08305 [Desulfobulbaceae bacterium]|nr:hypothetical protein [Desulfobulbaceae bacterium]